MAASSPPPDDPTLVGPGRRVVVDDEVPPPQVVRPYPWWLWIVAGICLAAAVVFLVLWLMERNDSSSVPSLVGLQQAEAERKAQDEGFNLEFVRKTGNETPGTVVGQAPEAGASLEDGSQMMAVVSAGPGQVTVPNVVGVQVDNAEQLLTQQGLQPERKTVTSPRPQGIVVDQEPPDAAQVARGSTVTLSVSNGQGQVTVPAVQGMSQADAVARVASAGLVPVVIHIPSTEPTGTVTAQDPAPNEKVQARSKVRINVSGGQAQTTTSTETITVTTSETTSETQTETVTTTTVPGP
jgi:serine/threonine-protein kinase